MERTNALHVVLPEKVDLVTIDVAWTRQRLIIPAAFRLLRDGGLVVTLVKPQYEATRKERRGGVLPRESVSEVLSRVRTEVRLVDGEILAELESPIKGAGGNTEFLWLVRSGNSTSEIRC
ncbi:MAG: Hemolysin A [Candidatus Latescibacteria bacterium ADurb.Bin168]|nr:MAG: Hemolysin A [Candidatus Latescibacteria bacterium ADurb.Bin168]